MQANLGLAANTLLAYRRGLADYCTFCTAHQIELVTATREHIARYVQYLLHRPLPARCAGQRTGLANATIQQRLTIVRLYYDFLVQEQLRASNPVGRGRYAPRPGSAGTATRGLVARYQMLPWIPTDEQWRDLLLLVRSYSLRNRLMLALAYDAGLRREELCALHTGDIDPAHRLLHIRAETTKGKRARVVPYSATTALLLTHYLVHRQKLTRQRGSLFVSESDRNRAQPLTRWSWSKVVRAWAVASDMPRLSTHTFRHLCLTDLARAGWELHEIATFAGHRHTSTTLRYIHLSGRDLAQKLARATGVHFQRLEELAPLHP